MAFFLHNFDLINLSDTFMNRSSLQNSIIILLVLLINFISSSSALAAQIKLAWDPNIEADLAGYKVYYGIASGTYGNPISVGNVTAYTLTSLTVGQTYYIVLTAIDTSNNESGYSNEVSGVATELSQTFTVSTNPSGLQVVVDGISYIAPQTFSWIPGSSHDLSVSSPQNGTPDIRYVYSSWSDGGVQSHRITVPSSSTTYAANFTTQFRLITSVNPAAGGGVTPTGTNWYSSGETVSVSASANAGYSFSNWSGDLSGPINPASLALNGSKNVTANFTTQDTTPPTTPTNLTATVVSSTRINLSWNASTDNVAVTGYRVFRGGMQIATTTTTSYANRGLDPNTTYTYTVAAYDAAGNVSNQSLSVSATTRTKVSPPKNFKATIK